MRVRELFVPEAEDGVVGGLMIRPDLCEEIGSFLSSKDFADQDRAVLYNLILSAHAKGISPDPISISDACDFLPSGERTIYVASMIQSGVHSAANAVSYARHVKDRAAARRLYSLGEMIMQLSQSEGSVPAQIAEAQQAMFDLNVADDKPDVQSYRQILPQVFDEIDHKFSNDFELGLEFGLPDLDKILQGLRPGNLVIVAGKPGTGKTVLGVNLADKIATREGKSALIFSLEMEGTELIKRSLSCAGQIPKNWIDKGGKSNGDYWANLTTSFAKLNEADVRVCDKGALTFSRICGISRFQHKAKPLDLIIVDYLTLIRADREEKFGTRSQEIGSFTRGFKALAKELGLPIVVLAQFNRASESRAASESEPRMSDLRDSGEIEQDADIVILGHRAEGDRGENGVTIWNVAKIRHSSPARCALQFQGEYQRFVSAAASEMQNYEESKAPRKQSSRSYTPGF